MARNLVVERWGAHVLEAERQGKSLWRYAQDHGVGYDSLNRARRLMLAAGTQSTVPARAVRDVRHQNTGGAFAQVQVLDRQAPCAVSDDRILVRMPSGAVIEFSAEGPETDRIAAVIAALRSGSCCASTPA